GGNQPRLLGEGAGRGRQAGLPVAPRAPRCRGGGDGRPDRQGWIGRELPGEDPGLLQVRGTWLIHQVRGTWLIHGPGREEEVPPIVGRVGSGAPSYASASGKASQAPFRACVQLDSAVLVE